MRRRHFIILAVMLAIVAVAFSVPLAKRRAGSIECGNRMVSIGFAARMWANDHNNRLPLNLAAMSNELNNPKILQCSGDRARQRFHSWAEFTETNSSYVVVSPGARDSDTNAVYIRCKVHGHLGYADGTVFDGKRRRTKTLF
jgi:hypothetical protein